MEKTRRAARHVTDIYGEALASVDLTGGQFSILVAVSMSGGATITPLAEGLGMDRTTLSRGLGPLERRGLIKLTNSKTDSRSRIVTLTPKGSRLLEKAIPLWEKAQTRVEASLTKSGLKALQGGLNQLSRV